MEQSEKDYYEEQIRDLDRQINGLTYENTELRSQLSLADDLISDIHVTLDEFTLGKVNVRDSLEEMDNHITAIEDLNLNY